MGMGQKITVDKEGFVDLDFEDNTGKWAVDYTFLEQSLFLSLQQNRRQWFGNIGFGFGWYDQLPYDVGYYDLKVPDENIFKFETTRILKTYSDEVTSYRFIEEDYDSKSRGKFISIEMDTIYKQNIKISIG